MKGAAVGSIVGGRVAYLHPEFAGIAAGKHQNYQPK